MSMATIVSSSTTSTRPSGMRALLREADRERRARPVLAAANRHRSVDLLDESLDELQAERRAAPERRLRREPDAVVAERERAAAVRLVPQMRGDRAVTIGGKRMFQGVGEELVHDQATGHRDIDTEVDTISCHE